jgi:hypothetical protein
MRRFASLLVIVCAAAVGCSRTPPPAGRWIGNYEADGVMVDARLEILSNGLVRASAPNMLDTPVNSDQERAAAHAQLAADLAGGWSDIVPRQMDFDGRVFRKPGGVAPQMEWDPDTHRMKVVFYFGTQHSIRIDMHAVSDFDRDPWAG